MISLVVLSLALAAPPVGETSCLDVLDANAALGCRSPDVKDPNTVVTSDEKPEAEKPMYAPGVFPAELGFAGGLTALVGGGVLAAAAIQTPRDDTGALVQQGTIIGGVAILALAGGIFSGAIATWVFDPSTAQLRLPIFEGEPR